jgi:hypothetical protein
VRPARSRRWKVDAISVFSEPVDRAEYFERNWVRYFERTVRVSD